MNYEVPSNEPIDDETIETEAAFSEATYLYNMQNSSLDYD